MVAVFAIERCALTPFELAMVFLAGGSATTAVQGGLVGRLAPRVGEQRLALVGLLLQAFDLVATVVAPLAWLLSPITIISAGSGLIYPSLTALPANQVPPQDQGRVAGVGTALSRLMSTVGPLEAGAAYDHVGGSAPFWTGALLLGMAAAVLGGMHLPALGRGTTR